MKKLLALVLVLSLASLASATMTLQISVDGNLDPVDSEITLLPSGTALLNIHSLNGFVGGDDEYVALVVDPLAGSITGGIKTAIAPTDTVFIGTVPETPGTELMGTGIVWCITDLMSGNFAPGTYIDEILFHCEGPADAIVRLYSTIDGETWNLEDSVIIHQPEPMTLSLLGLGGLFLRRRSK